MSNFSLSFDVSWALIRTALDVNATVLLSITIAIVSNHLRLLCPIVCLNHVGIVRTRANSGDLRQSFCKLLWIQLEAGPKLNLVGGRRLMLKRVSGWWAPN